MAEKLIELWKKQKDKEPKLKFTEFVYKYNHYFYSMGIFKKVHSSVGLKGKVNEWLRDFRKNHKLDLYTQKDIKEMSKKIVKSLKTYRNS